jgi:hypothetical protein
MAFVNSCESDYEVGKLKKRCNRLTKSMAESLGMVIVINLSKNSLLY